MTRVLLQRDKKGLLLHCEAEGHAGYAKSGSDIVCSAISTLLRTTLQTLSESESLDLEVEADKPGFLGFSVKIKADRISSENEDLLRYSGSFLEIGLGSICEEYPEYISLTKEKI